jgi:tetratricopeptide (TPR) repeat protein
VVTLTEEQGPKNGEELQVALMNLAVTQTLAGAPDAAEASYLRVIQMMESEGAMSSPRLARAQAGLAVAYHDSGRHDVAAERFERAIMMNRRNDGLFNDGQLPLLDKYADSLTMLDRIEDAHNVVRYGVRVVERKYGASSIEIVPRLEVAARWYTRVGAYDMAKAYLRRAIDIAERADGPNSAALVGPLTALAENYRRQMLAPVQQDSSASSADPQRATTSFESSTVPSDNQWQEAWFAGRERRDSDGERALTRALQIAEGQPKPSQAQIADVRTQLGDWYQTRLQQDKALTAYQRAWAAAQQVHMGDVTLADQLFAKPVLLHYVRPTEWDRYARRPPDQVTAHTVEIKLTVGDDGRVRDPSVVANDGSDKMAKAALEAVESARYRPRMVDGRPLTTPDVKFAQVFFEPLPQATAAPAAPATGKASDRS